VLLEAASMAKMSILVAMGRSAPGRRRFLGRNFLPPDITLADSDQHQEH
jgi:hypothetical protein